jgi:hypothetical protein
MDLLLTVGQIGSREAALGSELMEALLVLTALV